MKKPESLSVAHHATSPSEAELIRSILAGAGLYAVVADRNTPLPGVDLSPFESESEVIGCEVFVKPGDVARAKDVLQEARAAGQLPGDDDEYEEFDESDDDDSEE